MAEDGEDLARLYLKLIPYLCMGHFKLTSGMHSDTYFDKNSINKKTSLLQFLGWYVFNLRRTYSWIQEANVVVATGGALNFGLAIAVYNGMWFAGARKTESGEFEFTRNIAEEVKGAVVKVKDFSDWQWEIEADPPFTYGISLYSGVWVASADRNPERIFETTLFGRNVLIAEDSITTGGTVLKLNDLVEEFGGKVSGIISICKRGDVKLPVPYRGLVEFTAETWDTKNPCPLCRAKVPLNTDLGHGGKNI